MGWFIDRVDAVWSFFNRVAFGYPTALMDLWRCAGLSSFLVRPRSLHKRSASRSEQAVCTQVSRKGQAPRPAKKAAHMGWFVDRVDAVWSFFNRVAFGYPTALMDLWRCAGLSGFLVRPRPWRLAIDRAASKA
jgi:hypothetical protein